jgi:hypothetical protein
MPLTDQKVITTTIINSGQFLINFFVQAVFLLNFQKIKYQKIQHSLWSRPKKVF